MLSETFRIPHANRQIFVRRWAPGGAPRATVQIAHGLAEHSARYERLAEALTGQNFVVYASDHRGHGPECPAADLGFFADRDGWRACLDDLGAVHTAIKWREKSLPRIFLGHSMGAFLGQTFIAEHGGELAAAVLSGSNGAPPTSLGLGRWIARFENWRLGLRGKSRLVQALLFGELNKPFRPARTDFDWLSRDTREVDKYVADPLCGFDVTNSLALDLVHGLTTLGSPALAARVPKTLPIYIFSGSRDPVGVNLKGLIGVYRRAGLQELTVKLYLDGRHEMLNETNRDEVTADLIAWLVSRLT